MDDVKRAPRPSPSKNFAERLRVALAIRDWSGADLARALGVTRAAVAPWMRGAHMPSMRQIMAIGKALGVTASWLTAPRPVDLHGPPTDEMRATLIGLHVAGVLSEGQTVSATGLDRIEVRKRAQERAHELLGGAAHGVSLP
jgi:transcriptional regulator with XRE-family HTH domain